MADYWKDRMLDAQKKWTDKDIDAINKILRHYFRVARDSIVNEFVETYKKVLESAEEGRQVTPADLYKLDKYYQMNTQLEAVLKQLGDKTINVLANKFTQEYKHIYSALAIDEDGKAVKAAVSDKAFSTIASESAKQVASQVWCADGKSWNQRIWKDIENLKQTLNDGLIECVVTGKKTTELKQKLMERFGVTYNRAETLVRTEMAHIETQAALDRYKAHGVEKIRIVVKPDERTCKQCAEWDNKVISIGEAHVGENCPPFHPRCRDAIAAVVEDKKKTEESTTHTCARCGKKIKGNKNYCKNCEAILDKRWEDRIKKVGLERGKDGGVLKTPEFSKWFKTITDEENSDRLMYYCIDCSKPFYTKSRKSTAQKRCPECQAKYRKKYKAEKEKERRAKKKSK